MLEHPPISVQAAMDDQPTQPQNRGRRRNAIRITVVLLIVLLLAACSFVGCVFLGRLTSHWLLALTGDQDLSNMFAMLVFIPGSLYTFLYLLLLLAWLNSKVKFLKPTQGPRIEQTRFRQLFLLKMVGGASVLIALPILVADEVDFRVRVIGASTAIMSAFIVSYDLGQRISRICRVQGDDVGRGDA
jgi:hypothetical protein